MYMTTKTEEYLGYEVFVITTDMVLRGLPHRRVYCNCGKATLQIDIENGQYDTVLLLDEPNEKGFATLEISASWGDNTQPYTGFCTDDDRAAFWLGFAYEKLGINIPVIAKVEMYMPE